MRKFGGEEAWINAAGHVDDPHRWASEYGYLQGVGEDAGENVVMLTSSGAPAAPQAATTPSAAAAASGGTSILDTINKTLQTLIPTAAAVYQTKQIAQLNAQRLQQGLAPLSTAEIQAMQPQVGVQVGPSEQAKKLMLYAALGLGGLVALRAFKVI